MSPSSNERDLVTSLNTAFAGIAGWAFDHRWIVVLASLVLLIGSVMLAGRTRIDHSYESYFDLTDPTYLAYQQYREDFGSDEVSYVLYEAPGFEHGPWNIEVMRKIADLTKVLEDEVPFVYEVTTVVNAELTQGSSGGIEIREMRDAFPETQEELLALRDAFLAKPILVGGILSADAKYAAILIEMDRSSNDPPEAIRVDPERGDVLDNLYPQATDNAIEAILARPEYAGIAFYHSGDVPFNAAYNGIIEDESTRLNGITAALIAVLLLLAFRSIVGAVAPVVVVQVSVVMCVAFIGVLGWKLDIGFGGTPTLLTAIGVAHSVHILSEFRSRFLSLGDRREALVQTLYLVGTPCLLTSLTTAAGFAAMSFVPIKSIAHMGVYGAFGVLAAFVMSFTLLTALLSFGRVQPRVASFKDSAAKGGEFVQRMLLRIADFDVRHRRSILAGFAAIVLVSFAGIPQIVVDSNWLDDFSDDIPLKAVTAHVDEVMGGMTNVIYVFDAGEADGIKDPVVLREMERIQEFGVGYGDIVRKSYSLVDILKDLNQAFHDGDPAWYELPETRELVAQYLLLYEMSGGEDAEEYVSSDYRRASVEFRLAITSTSEVVRLIEAIGGELEAHPTEHSEATMTGIGALWVKLLDYIVFSQLQGFLLAFCAIALMMIAVFRSFKTGMISMIPNLVPVVGTLGVMGFLEIALDYNKIMIAAVAIGIAVDDTIHLVSRCRHEFQLCGNYVEALRASLKDVGRALLLTSIVLVAGFLVLLLSVLDSRAIFGILLATTIVSALIADFLLMPALVLTFEPFGPERSREGTSAFREAA